MVRRELILGTVVILAFVVCDLQAAQIAVSWDWGGDGRSWGDPFNWNPEVVPDNNVTNTYAVTIDAGAVAVDVRLQQSRTIDQLGCYGKVDLECWNGNWGKLTLTDVNGLKNHGELGIEDIEINGNVTNTAGAMLGLCDTTISGDLYNLATANVHAEVENDVYGTLQNDGTVTIIHASDLLVGESIHNNGLINIYDGECGVDEILDNTSNGVIKGFGVLYVDQLRNKGQIYAYGGSLAVASNSSFSNNGILGNKALSTLHLQPALDINNAGTIESNLKGGVVFDCNLINEPNGVIRLRDGALAAQTITQSEGAMFAGFGGMTGDVVIDPNGTIKLTGPTNVVGDVEINENATLEISDGLTLITGQTTCNGTIHMKGGYVIPQGGLSGECNVIWEPGLYTNIADFNLDGQVNFKDLACFANTWLWESAWK